LKLAILSRPELVLLDIALPGMNGLELLKRIRSIIPSTGVIMVSGNTDPVLAREALELGALAYVDKPFDFAYRKRVIAMALGEVDNGARTFLSGERASAGSLSGPWAGPHHYADVGRPRQCCALRH